MFAKRSTFVIPTAPEPSGGRAREIAALVLGNPALSAAAAGGLFLLCALVLILAAANPKAGLPHIRIHLADPSAAPPGWREALTAEMPGAAPVSVSGLELLPGGAAGDQPQGQAVITLPGAEPAPGDHAGQALPAAPITGLTEPGPGGALLPIIAQDGRTPAQAYARPFHSNGKPKIALVIGGLGLNSKTTRQAIEQLPPEVTLSFVPYSEGLQGWIDLARANGHEVLIEAPMEPNDYPDNDPGPYTLMAQGRTAETIEKLDWVLSRATGYFGVTNYLGSKFLNSDQAMTAFTGDLHQRGLAFIDDGTAVKRGGGIPRASADAVIDDQLAGDAIDKQLILLEADATRNGQALGSGFAYPLTLDQVARWATTLAQRGYQLAPASAVTMRR
ncbi:divergent polysaccharide deacetylase family protein [Phenylobacterium montanum]|uniref:Divergent polysaccharide deacetylase family protein n=1 Tax=Phenylobacterium montanum TaxID=2823693 RepID=A0A975ITT8_9CAUL|nr:divergent polysaccharide deacetylase family protein [Caulobacter sp. S6]QUD86819.1 divergent polysaccharide deacetylase family protein [Caulobacter sp. S6]